MNQNYENSRFELWDLFRGNLGVNDYLSCAVLLDKVRDENAKKPGADPYELMLIVADREGVSNPFPSKDVFYDIYKAGGRLSDWDAALADHLRFEHMPVIPLPLLKKFSERLTGRTGAVLIAEAERFITGLKGIIDDNSGMNFTLTTQNNTATAVLKKIFSDYDNVEILTVSIYEYGFLNSRFDYIFSVPTFGVRTLVDDQNFMCREYESVALENLSYHLTSGGELIIILPARVTFTQGKTANLRQFIQETYTIKEISSLPEGIFEFSGIRTYLLSIENTHPNDDDIVIRKYSGGQRKTKRDPVKELIAEDDTFVMPDELIQLGDWNIDKIFAQQDNDWLKYQNSGIKKDVLENVSQVFRGKSILEKSETGSIGVVNISCIGEYEIDFSGIDYIDEEERKITSYLLREGDVLIPARGTAIRSAVFHAQSFPCIANSNVIVIRPDGKNLNSTFLKIFLDSPLGKKLISGVQQGVTVMNISYKDLMSIEVPTPSIDIQEAASGVYLREYRQYKETVAVAEAKWNSVLDELHKF